jgi:predicted membrane protein
MTSLRWILLFVTVIAFRVWFPGNLPQPAISLDYDVVVIVLAGLYRGQRIGAGAGWTIGFLAYAIDPDHMAWGGLLGALLGWLIGHLRERLFLEQLLHRWLVFATGIIGYKLFHYVLVAGTGWADFPRALLISLLPSALIDATAGVVFGAVWERTRHTRLSIDERRSADESV